MDITPSTSNIIYAFLLTLMAGLSTGIGGIVIWKAKRTNRRLLSVGLGFSAGVMVYVSFVELFVEGRKYLAEGYSDPMATALNAFYFFVGILFVLLIDHFVPQYENPHELPDSDIAEQTYAYEQRYGEEIEAEGDAFTYKEVKGLARTGFMAAVAVGVHNFPEGMATFASSLACPRLGITIAIAIAIHNIPEGITVAVPFYYATGDKKRAFRAALVSGMAEPIGALAAFVFLLTFLSPAVLGTIFSMVSGIMVFIAIDVLLPSAEKYGEHHMGIYGFVAGMGVMAISLLVL